MRFWGLLLCTGLLVSGCGWLPVAPKPEAIDQVAPGVTVEGVAVGGLSRAELDAVIRDLAARQYQPTKNARFDDSTGEILADAPGRTLDTAATAQAVLAAPPDSRLTGTFRVVTADVDTARLRQARRSGAYTSPLLDDSPGRLVNIRLTAALINNAVLEPGGEFSFNHRTGEPTPKRGFQLATVFVDGRQEQDWGGGMCQVSSTLYNAVLAAGLAVVERHPHSRPVSYVPPGCDATTFTDKDLRFVNSTRRTLVIRALVRPGQLEVDIWELPAAMAYKGSTNGHTMSEVGGCEQYGTEISP